MSFLEDQEWERNWWASCANTLSEELKQLSYFKRLGLTESLPPLQKTRFVFDIGGKRIVDIGGGPASFLLKCVNFKGFVIDPCKYPQWIAERYYHAGIGYYQYQGEEIPEWLMEHLKADEVWMYNVLQHVLCPEKIIQNAQKMAHTIRFFDWIEAGVHPGHPQNLTAHDLNSWLGGVGTVEDINENDAFGKCYYGVFTKVV